MRSVKTLAEVRALWAADDGAEMLEGYRDGLKGEPEPGNNRSDAYWHGWRNGACDRGLRKSDPEQYAIAAEYVARSRETPARSAEPTSPHS